MSETLRVVAEWLEFAEDDYLVAQSLLKEGSERFSGSIAYHSQQCIEKLFKAVLIKNKVIAPKSHDLVQLNTLISPHLEDWSAPLEDLELLSFAITDGRYPGNRYDQKDAEQVFNACERLRTKLLKYF